MRESRFFFYVDSDGRVSRVRGFACEGTEGYWWCPSLGVSAAEGHSLFSDRVEAYEKAHAAATHTLELAKANLARIKAERFE